MKCEKLREEFMEAVLSGPETASLEVQEHLRSCAACADELASLRQTMSLLDEWQAPEPSRVFQFAAACALAGRVGRTGAQLARLVAATGGSGGSRGSNCRGRGIAGDRAHESTIPTRWPPMTA